VADIVTFGSDKPPWRPSRRLILTCAGTVSAVAAGMTAFALVDHHEPVPVAPAVSGPAAQAAGPSCRPLGTPPRRAATEPPAGLIIDCAGARGSSLERRDRTAGKGPWTVVVRRLDGSLGRHGAVVTFPVAAPPAPARRVDVGGTAGTAGPGMVTWPVAGTFARVRGDLPESELVAIGAGTTVVAGRPAVKAPAGYAVAAAGPYRSPTIHETRYGTADVGEQGALGNGLTYTGVAGGGGFEDQLYAVHTSAGGQVGGRRAVLSSVFGGNGALAWEPAPGVVAYVGYSGASLSDEAVSALRRLAGRARAIGDRQWRASGPHTVDQSNEPG
jgi:hypothetical protein